MQNKTRQQKLDAIKAAMAGKASVDEIAGRHIWIETADGYRELNGGVMSKDQFKKWAENTALDTIITLPDNGRDRLSPL